MLAIESRRRFAALGVSVVMLSLLALPHGATAATNHARKGRVLAHQVVHASSGAWVKARNGVSIFVPPGAMARSGRVSIAVVRRGVFDVHIAVPWHGTVAVSLPLSAHGHDTILHHVGSVWMTEGMRRGVRTVWVTQLSWFTTLVSKISQKYCLTFNVQELFSCIANMAADKIDSKVISWIQSRLPHDCASELAVAEAQGFKSGALKGALLGLLKQMFSGDCQGQAGEYYHVPTGPAANSGTPGSSPTPTPTPNPTPAPSPLPAREFGVMNATGGIYWRSGTDWNTPEATAGNGFYPGTTISVSCYQSGAADVPGSSDSTWEQATWVSGPGSGSGWINEHFINDGAAINQPSPGVPACGTPSSPPPPPASTWAETVGGVTHTWTDYSNAGGTQGPYIQTSQTVQVACAVQGSQVADGDTWWYRIASAPWSGAYYVSADAFYNNGQTSGSLNGTPFVDPAVAHC